MNVEEIRALCDAATGGPWEIYRYRTGGGRIHLSGDDGRRRTLIADMEGTEGDIATVYNEGDREFLFAARTLVPELADRVEQAERVAAELREENAFLRAENDARCGRDDYDPAPIITMYDGKVAECEALRQRIAAVEQVAREIQQARMHIPPPSDPNRMKAIVQRSTTNRILTKIFAALAAEPSGPPESKEWWADCSPGELASYANEVVHWVTVNGGEAWYPMYPVLRPQSGPSIGVRTKDGWVYAKPGDTVQMTDEWFNVQVSAEQGFTCRAFRVVSEPSGARDAVVCVECGKEQTHRVCADCFAGPEPTTSDDPSEHQLEHESYGTWPCAWNGSGECPIVAELARRDATGDEPKRRPTTAEAVASVIPADVLRNLAARGQPVRCEHGQTERHEVPCQCGGVFHLDLCPGPAASGEAAVER